MSLTGYDRRCRPTPNRMSRDLKVRKQFTFIDILGVRPQFVSNAPVASANADASAPAATQVVMSSFLNVVILSTSLVTPLFSP